MERHFTATVYIFHQNKVLLHKHLKFNKWLPPGGHLEPNETPTQAARREVLEEANLDIIFLDLNHLHLDFPHASTLERPFHILLENIPEKNSKPAHQHIDLIYLAKPSDPSQLTQLSTEFQWFDATELVSIEHELFLDAQRILALLFTSGGGEFVLPSESSLLRPPSSAHRMS